MNPGLFNRIITISYSTETIVTGDVSVTWSTPVEISASVKQVNGSRFVNDPELVDKLLYEIKCYDNNYPDNIKIGYNGMTLHPARPLTRNPGGSFLNEVSILATTKDKSIVISLLTVPTLFSVTVISDTQIDLAWTNNIDGNAVIIERSLNGNDFAEIYRTLPGVAVYSNTGLTALTRYYYRIRAFDGVNYSAYSNVEDVTTNASIIDPVPVTVRDITKTVAWYASDAHVVKDANNFVYKWEDNNAVIVNDLIQAIGTAQPLWTTDGVLFDGIDNYLKTAAIAALDQPEFIYAIIKQLSFTAGDYIFDGSASNKGALFQGATSPLLAANAGTSSAPSSDLILNTWGIVRVLFNGVNSKLQVNDNAPITWNCGTNQMQSFVLGTKGSAISGWSNIQVKEIILRNVDDTGADEIAIYNYLATKYGFATI